MFNVVEIGVCVSSCSDVISDGCLRSVLCVNVSLAYLCVRWLRCSGVSVSVAECVHWLGSWEVIDIVSVSLASY